MIRVQIDGDERRIDQADSHWVVDRINRGGANGRAACLRVFVDAVGVELVFSAGGCPSGAGSWRTFTDRERDVISLWDRFGLRGERVDAGRVNAFLQQLKHLV